MCESPSLQPPPLRGANHAYHGAPPFGLPRGIGYADVPGEGEGERGSPILTIGHSNHPAERLIELLHLHGVSVLADVRSQPYSSYAHQFNRENLQPVVTDAGLRYLFMGEELGGRQLGRIDSLHDRLAAYEHLAATPQFQGGLARVMEVATTSTVAILCAEEDPTECHRRVWVARALRERGVGVSHIRGDGRLDADDALKRLEPPAGRQLGLFDA